MRASSMARCTSRFVLLSATIVFTLVVPKLAFAQSFGNLDLVVDRTIFESVCDQLRLTDAQRELARACWLDYLQQIEALVRELDEHTEEAGASEIRRVCEEARASGQEPPWDRINALQREVKKQWVRGLRRSDEHLRRWLEDIRAVLNEEQIEYFDAVEPLIRRLNAEVRRGQGQHGRFIRNVDMHRLVDKGASPEQTLYEWVCAASTAEPPELEDFEARLTDVMNQYDLLLDRLIVRSLGWSRRKPDDDYSIFIGRDPEVQSLTVARMRLSLNTARHVEWLIADLFGENARAAWNDRFNRALAPFLYYEYVPQYVYRSIQQMEGIEPIRLERIEAIHQSYQSRLATLRRQAMSLGLATEFALLEADAEDMADGLLPVHVRFSKLLHTMREMMLSTAQQMASSLLAEQRKLVEALIFDSKAYDPKQHLPSWNYLEKEAALGVDLPDPVIVRPAQPLIPRSEKENSK